MASTDRPDTEHLRLRIVEMVKNQSRGDVALAKTRAQVPETFDKTESVRNTVLLQQGQLKPDTVTDRSTSAQYRALPTAYRSKSRAAAWLIKRFHKRQDIHADSAQLTKNAKAPDRQFDHDHVFPVNQTLELSKLKARNVNHPLDGSIKTQEQRSNQASATFNKNSDSSFVNLRSDQKSRINVSEAVKPENKRVTPMKSNTVLFRGDNDINYDPRKDKPRGFNKMEDSYSAEPVFLKDDRRKGIFSASLENFKKRLQLASNKISMLNEDKENRAEKLNDHFVYPPLNHVPHPPALPRNPREVNQSSQVEQASGKKPKSGKENVDFNTFAKLEHAHETRKESLIAQKSSHAQRFLNSGSQTPQLGESQTKRDILYRNRKPLSRIGENESENVQARTSTSRVRVTPAPLTMHNLRVHDSLQSAYERRNKRLNQLQPTQLQLQQQVMEGGSFVAVPGDRMWQWLDEVTLESTSDPTVVTVIALNSSRDQMKRIETPRLLKERMEIFV
ncbi:uncharacterized protein LOC106064836 [Biomphalaria glabrata]|uniref:Uncharacterized protein LOC106064836 n=1 Tax=Biomphalaria glabrata TaxID=6526 RepID=A0A9U8E9D0_BIOGL|nr:uncharacterized protein LOC106064836 [Biomphalaria glabrata]KAI8777531.1 hypothetical protein BgiBS90_021734 [Biomphalaria glabrata]